MSASATALIKLAARAGHLPADVARVLVDKVRGAPDPMRLAEHLLVQGGHCTIEQVARLRAEASVLNELPPTTIAGFRLIERIGAGGMGEVYRAQQISMQRTVALKLLSRELLQDDALGQRFLREARAAGKLNHPHVVGCFDVGVADGRFFMALEYVAGGDAERLMRAYDHRLGERRALEIARDCALGLEALHGAGFIHRDIKPSNILLTEDGLAKIGDLGLVATATPERKLTQSGAAMGTPAYMSPEQADGAPDLDARTDLYSLGASLFYLLTGHPPYTGQSAWAVVAKVINDPFPDPRRLNPDVSPACAALVLKATAKDRTQRYASAQEFRRALDGLLARGDLPVVARASVTHVPGATMTSVLPPVRGSRRAWVIPAVIGVAVLVIVVQGFLLLMRPAAPVAKPMTVAEAAPVVVSAAPPTTSSAPAPNVTPPVATVTPTAPVTVPAPAAENPKKADWLQQPPAPTAVPPATSVTTTPPAVVPVPVPRSPLAEAAPPVPKAAPVVAVLGCEAGDLTLRDFAKAFPELLTVSLTRKGAFDLVERTQLRQVLNEQELTQSGMIDSSNAARIGKLVGARVLITQRVYAVGDYTYVSAKAIDVETGRVKAVSKGELKKNATPAVMAAQVAIDLGKAVDALSGATPSDSDEVATLLKRLSDAVRGKRLPIVVIAVEESHIQVPAPDPAVRTELGYLLRKSGFRVIESDSPALATWAKEYAAGRTAAFPADLGAVEVVLAGSGVSQSVGGIGQLVSARARLEVSAIAVKDGQVLAVERATTSAADASEILAGKLALEKGVRQLALSLVSDLTTAWNAR
jgi:eukaryotic-like serine/threonine-protein kinase